MKPIKAKDLLELDKNLKVVMIQCYPLPEQVVWQAGRGDYAEIPAHELEVPKSNKCGEWIVEQLLANERGHYGPLEHPAITFSVSGYVHSVMVQARTHRVGVSFDVQSQRYTGKRVLKVASGELDPQEVFYVRPPGFYTNRKGKNMIGPKKIMKTSISSLWKVANDMHQNMKRECAKSISGIILFRQFDRTL